MRVFAGLQVSGEMREALYDAAEAAKKLFPGKYAWKENYHCTLKFIGEAGDQNILAICDAIKAAAQGTDAFSIELSQLSYFRKPTEAVLFFGLKNCPPLNTLAQKVDQALQGAGYPLEQGPYHPHITLARQAKIDTEMLSSISIAPITSMVTDITLFESCRIGGQLRYVPLFAYSLGK